MVLSLLVSTGLIVAMSATVETIRQSNIDLIADAVGRYDLAVSKKDTSLNLYMPIEETAAIIQAADERITAVHPRIEISVEFPIRSRRIQAKMVGLDSVNDTIGTIEVKEGAYVLGDGRVAVFEETAREYGLAVGDVLQVAHALPVRREVGKSAEAGASRQRVQRPYTIGAIIVQNGVTGGGNGMLVELSDLQTWLNLPGQAKQMLVMVEAGIYQTNNAEVAALQVRSVSQAVQQQLGEAYDYRLDKAATLSQLRQFFQSAQALINTYGLISLGVVGLLVYTLVMTNVQEQRRDMAVLRILGSGRNLLFALVIVEVVVIGLIGVGLGILLGQAITAYVVVPLIVRQLAQAGLTVGLTPQVTVSAILPAIVSAFVVLILSGIKPAEAASRTKVMHAINPGVADNIQLEDLTQLRERRPDGKMFLWGAILMSVFTLLAGFEALAAFGGPAIEVIFALMALFLLVLGLGMIFFITTIPFERLVLAFMRLFFPRLTYFAARNVSRGQTRNTLIAMLVLFSGVLPSFLATQLQMENANFETNARMTLGAPVRIESYSAAMASGEFQEEENVSPELAQQFRLHPRFVANDLATVPGLAQLVGLSYPYASTAGDSVGLRTAPVNVVGVGGDLNQVVFQEMMTFTAGGPAALSTLLTEADTVIISEGLAAYLSVGMGDVIHLQGAGIDHVDKVRVVGIARRIPGMDGIGRSRTAAQSGSVVLVSLPHFGRIVTAVNQTAPGADAPMLDTVLATLSPQADPQVVATHLFDRFEETQPFDTRFLALELNEQRNEQTTQRTFLLVLTGISFTTAVFGVFAVIYVTIYARRIEIGMLKSMGMLRRELTGMLVVEAIVMTLGAALAGIAAGASMGYLSFYMNNILRQLPVQFAVDTTVMPAIVVLVAVASILGATFSARRIVRKQAVEILRM